MPIVPKCTEEPAHFCTTEMHSSHTISPHCYAEHALHCRDCDPMISFIANYTLTLEFHISSSVTSHSQDESMQNEPFSPGLKAHPNLKVMTTKGMDKTLVQTQALQIRRHST